MNRPTIRTPAIVVRCAPSTLLCALTLPPSSAAQWAEQVCTFYAPSSLLPDVWTDGPHAHGIRQEGRA